jgi:hypothetical protein
LSFENVLFCQTWSTNLESIAVDQAWLSPRLCWIMLVRRIIKVPDQEKTKKSSVLKCQVIQVLFVAKTVVPYLKKIT